MTDRELKQIYNQFEKKDMTFPEFLKACRRLEDPKTMVEDFARIRHMRTTKGQIDKAVRGQER